MSHPIPTERRDLLLRLLNAVLVLCSVCSLGLLIFIIGWPVPAEWSDTLRLASRCVLATFATQEVLRVLFQGHPLEYARTHKFELFLVFVIVAEILLRAAFYKHVGDDIPFTLFYLALSQLTLLLLAGVRALRNNAFLGGKNLAPGMLFMLTLALLSAVGTLLLKTPNATVRPISWVDALFTATSAVSVTGLTTLDLARDFTFTGQCIVLALVQIGGLGVMTFTYFIACFLAGGVSLRSRYALQDMLSEDNLGQIRTVLATIFVFTLGCEAAGAALIYSQLEMESAPLIGQLFAAGSTSVAAAGNAGAPITAAQASDALAAAASAGIPPDERVFFSVFHAVTAFCNAGFSTLNGNLADNALRGRTSIVLTLVALVFAGGLGFPVVKNCWQHYTATLRRLFSRCAPVPPRLESNTRLVLTVTLSLCVAGTIAIYVTENLLPSAGAQLAADGTAIAAGSPHPPWLAAIIDAFASRTAGFTASTGWLFADSTAMLVMFLMFVGGGPSSTAGGIKTTTLGVAILALRRIVLGRSDIEAFGRRLDDGVAHRALATILLALVFTLCVSLLLCVLEPKLRTLDLVFESVSAASTCGMSRGVTAQLHTPAKLVLVVTMFIGRVGVLTTLLALIKHRDPTGYRFPQGNVIIN